MAMTNEEKLAKMEAKAKEMAKEIKAINPRYTKKIEEAKSELADFKKKIKVLKEKICCESEDTKKSSKKTTTKKSSKTGSKPKAKVEIKKVNTKNKSKSKSKGKKDED